MINLDDCIEIGQFTRPHGYKGTIILKLRNFSFEEIENMEWVYVIIDGLPVPFFVNEFSEKSIDSLLVKLEDITSIEDTGELINSIVYIDRDILSNSAQSKPSMSFVIGFEVVDNNNGYIGVVDSLIDNSDNPLLRILNGKEEILLPLQEEFIGSIDEMLKKVFVECPPGLIDLFKQ